MQLIEVLALPATLGVVFLLVLAVRRLGREIYKDRLFRLRERWFDLALDENSSLQFDSPMYIAMEGLLCGLLRSSKTLSVELIICFKVFELFRRGARDDARPKYDIESDINQIDDAYTRAKAISIWRWVPYSMHSYLCGTSALYFLWDLARRALIVHEEISPRAEKDIEVATVAGYLPHPAS